MSQLLRACAGALVVFFLIRKAWQVLASKTQAPYPPGPPRDPIIGNLRVLPYDRPEVKFREWSKQYNSDVIYLDFIRYKFVVLNSVKPALALLDKKGGTNSDRPEVHFFAEQGWDTSANLASLSQGPAFKKHRRLFQNAFSTGNCIPYQQLQQNESRKAIMRILKDPERWERNLVQFTTAIIMRTTYGHTVDDYSDHIVKLAERVLNEFTDSAASLTAVDIFPFLRRLPRWFRLVPSLNFARDSRSLIVEFREAPYAQVKKDIESGIAQPSLVSKVLEAISQQSSDEKMEDVITERDLKGAGAVMFFAAHDTTFSSTMVFIFNMVHHPEVQKKARAEIDAVVGKSRLPTFDDRPNLPYINRILQEILRWHPAAPLGVTHVSTKDDVYEGMFIPKGAYIVANSHAMTHDETIYHDPYIFDPDRYLSVEEGGAGEPLPVGQWGFGRRICPGRHLATNSLWIMVATMLATLDISKAKDEDGHEITPPPEMSTGVVSRPKPFPCVMKPRLDGLSELFLKE